MAELKAGIRVVQTEDAGEVGGEDEDRPQA